jgi:tetratricopeptide (TPR) repeat protein
MKKSILLFVLILISVCIFSQPGNKPKPKEKPPTQKEMEAMMKEAEKMIGEISAEDKKMMDSLGIKMPSFKNVPKVTDKQLAEAWDDENRIVPKRDAARIAAIPGTVTDAGMAVYIAAINKNVTSALKPELVVTANKVYEYIKSNSKNSGEAGNMATGLWLAGKPEMAMHVLGKICAGDAGNTDNLSNYASMLSMLGAEHLSIPILNNLNAKFPKNSTLLNNLGQAWFGLGEIPKAEKYLDSVIRIYAYHPQANLTKASIEEHKGNTEKAREALKNSMQHSYTKEKEEKLAQLGHKLTSNDFRLPKRTKADPLNLGSFQTPGFPSSVEECILSEKEWIGFYKQVISKHDQLEKLKKQADEKAVQSHQQRMNAALNLVKTAQANPGTSGQFTSVPLYAGRANKLLKAYIDQHEVKMKAFHKKLADFGQGEGKALNEAYEKEMEKLRKEDDEQTGEGLPNKDFCPRYKEASDKYLKAVNPKLYQFYLEDLKLKKEFINENAYWYMYIQWPEMYEASKLSFQMGWLGALTQGKADVNGPVYSFPFVSITEFVCKKQEKEPGETKLQKFDDVACQYNDTMDLKIVKIANNCSRMTSEFDFMFLNYVRKDDFERAEGDTYIGSTIKVSAEAGKGASAGPIKVEAKIGAGIELELDREGVKDVILIGELKVGAGTSVLDEYKAPPKDSKAFDRDGIGIAGKDAIPTTVEVGLEGRISIITGKVSLTRKATGIKDIKIKF